MGNRFDREAERVAFAARRATEHADRELELLTRATQAESDARARELEWAAQGAYEDFIAMIREHGLDG